MPEAATKSHRLCKRAPISLRSANGYGCRRTRGPPPPWRPPPRLSPSRPCAADWITEMPSQVSAHSRASGNPDAGPPPARGRATATAFCAAALLPLLLGPAGATEPDLAFGAFQTGHYLTAFNIAT